MRFNRVRRHPWQRESCACASAFLRTCEHVAARLFLFLTFHCSYDVIVKIDTWSDTPLRSHSPVALALSVETAFAFHVTLPPQVWRKATRERLLKGLNSRARLELEGEVEGEGATLKSGS